MLLIIFSVFGKKTIFPFASHDCVAFSWVDKLLDKLAVENELGKFHFLLLLLSPPLLIIRKRNTSLAMYKVYSYKRI